VRRLRRQRSPRTDTTPEVTPEDVRGVTSVQPGVWQTFPRELLRPSARIAVHCLVPEEGVPVEVNPIAGPSRVVIDLSSSDEETSAEEPVRRISLCPGVGSTLEVFSEAEDEAPAENEEPVPVPEPRGRRNALEVSEESESW
jgi:hypothetical protein